METARATVVLPSTGTASLLLLMADNHLLRGVHVGVAEGLLGAYESLPISIFGAACIASFDDRELMIKS